MDDEFMSIIQMAQGLDVMPDDILKWIREGKIKATKIEDTYQISIEEYQRYGRTFPIELRDKIGENMWKAQLEIFPEIQKEVSERFRSNSQFVLDRDESAVKIIETIHKRYEPNVEIFKDKRGAVAAFILYARVISLLYSIILLLRIGIPSESFILFRPLWEATLLAEYFWLSGANNENKKQIRRWFEKDETPTSGEVRYYLADKLGLPIKTLQELNNRYSKPIHHAYNVIMESYRGVSMNGFLGEFSQRQGFDYHQSRVMGDIVSRITVFENLLLSCLKGFYLCFSNVCTEEEAINLKVEIDFYNQKPLKRLESIFANKDKDEV